jgi:hypothetical protein
MPKDEFDFDDPLELNGMAFLTHEDTTDAMAETFIEEFLRLGYGHKQVLALFRNPHYLGPNLALEKRGEPFIRDLIAEVFARSGRKIEWPVAGGSEVAQTSKSAVSPISKSAERDNAGAQAGLATRDTAGSEACATQPTDPTGAPAPKFTV